MYMFLPSAHVLARVTQAVALDVGGDDRVLERRSAKIVEDLAGVAPTHFPAVPRVYEKIHTAVVDGIEGQVPVVGGRCCAGRSPRAPGPRRDARGTPARPDRRAQHRLADRLVLSKVRHVFGERLVMAVVGAAPIAPELIEFFDACGSHCSRVTG